MGEPSSAEAVFCEALEKGPAGRAAFLDRACAGNEPLRREVQSLLDAYQKVGPFLERPLAGAEGVAELAVAGATDSGDTLPFLAPSPEPGSLGRLDHYEVRGWIGWHHHMTLALVALWFLCLERRRVGGENPGDHGLADAAGVHAIAPSAGAECRGDRRGGLKSVAA